MLVEAKKYFCYHCGPIDWWEGWRTVPEAIAAERTAPRQTANRMEEIATIINALGERLSGQLHWEGDGVWRVAPLPDPENLDSIAMFAIKQSNNGATFICSPRQLPWLEEQSMWWKEVDL